VNDAAFASVASVLKPADYFRTAHQILFAAMARIHARGAAIDLVTLRAELGAADLAELTGQPTSRAYVTGSSVSSAFSRRCRSAATSCSTTTTITADADARSTSSSMPTALRSLSLRAGRTSSSAGALTPS
jgi:hypothetical protein